MKIRSELLEMKVLEERIARIYFKQGLCIGLYGDLTEGQKNKVLELYHKKENCKEIAKKLGLKVYIVYRYIDKIEMSELLAEDDLNMEDIRTPLDDIKEHVFEKGKKAARIVRDAVLWDEIDTIEEQILLLRYMLDEEDKRLIKEYLADNH